MKNRQSVLAIIPARGGSKRIPRKNIRKLCGKTLLEWAIHTAMEAQEITRLVVSSDDDAILDLAGQASADLPLKRPDAIAGDDSPAIEYVQHALAHFQTHHQESYDVVAIMQATSPLTLPEDIDATISLLKNGNAQSAVSVVRVPADVHPIKMQSMADGYLMPYVEEEKGRMAPYRHDDIYVRNRAVYATRKQAIDEGKIIGDPCVGYIMPRERSVDIHEEFDLVFADYLMTKYAKSSGAESRS